MRNNYGWTEVGTRGNVVVPRIRTRNISVVAALSIARLEHFQVFETSVNADRFMDYLRNLLPLIRDRYRNNARIPMLVMDNARIHKTRAVLNLLKKVTFLPPYSPFLNPIENIFSLWKRHVRGRKPNTEAELFQCISSFELPERVAANCFNHIANNIAEIAINHNHNLQ